MPNNLAARLARWTEVFNAIGSPLAAGLLHKASAAVAEGRKDAALARDLLSSAAARTTNHQEAAAIMREAAGVLSED